MTTCPLCNATCESLSDNNVCERCEDRVQTHAVPRMRQLAESMGIVGKTKNADTKRRRLEFIVRVTNELLKYERAGVPTCEPLPSELLRRYTAMLRESEDAERVSFCGRCNAMIPWGSRMCPECNRNPDRQGPMMGTIEDWRRTLTDQLDKLERENVREVEWWSARDKHVCALCREACGKRYTISQARAHLAGEFCYPGDRDQNCRCMFLPCVEGLD